MPSPIDLYGLTGKRDQATLDQFLDDYVDSAASWDRGDEEVTMDPLDGAEPGPADWFPTRTLGHIVEWGLAHPDRAFFVWLKAKHDWADGINLGFTSDNQLVLGFGLDEERLGERTIPLTNELLSHLRERYGCYLGVLAAATPPPSNEAEFRTLAGSSLTILFWDYST